ncbi:MAG: glycine dehydrogenase (aminomethyl-transferring), partial [Halioglobus sp.]|nr:glycine dehydrogenase (aminomethyl-transferring) [Halioglobus sp.]
MSRLSLFDLENHGDFIQRHIGPEIEHQITMARAIGYESLDALIDDTVPAAIRRERPMQLPGAQTEQQVIARLRELANLNVVNRSFIGMGYHDTVTPPVIQRNVLENP